MLTQIVHWMQVVGTVVDAVLLARLLALRLHRTYIFIALSCALVLFFDATDLWFGSGSVVSNRIFVYSRFLCIVLFPLVVWDVFEELKTRIAKIRRMALSRLVSGMFSTLLLAFVMAAFLEADDTSGQDGVTATIALVVWAGASTVSLAFLITMHRVLRSQPIELPSNTSVWMRFYELSLAQELVSCFLLLLFQFLKSQITVNALLVVLNLYGIVITLWCVRRLRRVPSEDATQSSAQAAA